jgi:hypothetical protein
MRIRDERDDYGNETEHTTYVIAHADSNGRALALVIDAAGILTERGSAARDIQ